MHPHADTPSDWITRHSHLVRPGTPVLDVACGGGRHARWFAERGSPVLAVDRDTAQLDSLRHVSGVTVLEADLERDPWPFGGRTFNAVVVTNYLYRPLFAKIAAAVADDGVLLYETFAAGNEVFGRPSNPAFLLRPNELWEMFSPTMTIVAFEQGEVRRGSGRAVLQRLAAVGRARPWPAVLDVS